MFDAETYATAGSEEKRQVCRALGVKAAVDYHDADWPEQIRAAAGGKGMDVVLDGQAGPYTQKQLDLLDFDGRLVLIASHLAEISEVNTRQLVRRHAYSRGLFVRSDARSARHARPQRADRQDRGGALSRRTAFRLPENVTERR
jgi:NADPH:quinone reductase-like Zn-dependent oxidoreductase